MRFSRPHQVQQRVEWVKGSKGLPLSRSICIYDEQVVCLFLIKLPAFYSLEFFYNLCNSSGKFDAPACRKWMKTHWQPRVGGRTWSGGTSWSCLDIDGSWSVPTNLAHSPNVKPSLTMGVVTLPRPEVHPLPLPWGTPWHWDTPWLWGTPV